MQRFDKIAKAQLKKVTKMYAAEKRKSQEREKKEVKKMYCTVQQPYKFFQAILL